MEIQRKKITELNPAPYNPRKSNKKQEDNLRKSLEKFGVVEPIIFNKRTGYIVGGHFRTRELKKLGVEEVDCVIVDLNEDDEKELNIRLNANTGEWNWEMLQAEWDLTKLEEWGVDVPEWDNEEVLEADEQKDLSSTIDNLYRIEIICEDEKSQELLYNELIEKNYKCRLLTL